MLHPDENTAAGLASLIRTLAHEANQARTGIVTDPARIERLLGRIVRLLDRLQTQPHPPLQRWAIALHREVADLLARPIAQG